MNLHVLTHSIIKKSEFAFLYSHTGTKSQQALKKVVNGFFLANKEGWHLDLARMGSITMTMTDYMLS